MLFVLQMKFIYYLLLSVDVFTLWNQVNPCDALYTYLKCTQNCVTDDDDDDADADANFNEYNTQLTCPLQVANLVGLRAEQTFV